MIGRRLPDVIWGMLPDDIRPGDYWKILDAEGNPKISDQPTNLTGTIWEFYCPDGNGVGTLISHTVREHEDGTISVLPGDGSSNSILHSGARKQSWHGYIRNGVWEEC